MEGYESDDNLSSIITLDDEEDWRDAVRRSGHVAVEFDNVLVVWGGSRCGPPTPLFNDYCDPNILWVYNTRNDIYTKLEISGLPPPGSCGSCAVIHDGSLYIFGGFCRDASSNSFEYSNVLFKLDLTTNKLTWHRIVPKGVNPLPCDKLAGWVHGDKLYFFGGFGRFIQGCGESTWVRDDYSDRGWNNQFFCYNTKTNSWEWPRTYGSKPHARAAHAAAISGHTAYIFGGRMDDVRNDQLHSINLQTMTWSGDLKTSVNGLHWPCGRSWHTFTFVSPNVAFIKGGMSTTAETLDDIWKLTFENDAIDCQMYPTHNVDGKELSPILWHQSVFFPKGNEIITIGGMKQLYGEDYTNNHNRMFTLRLSPKSLFRLCLDTLEGNVHLITKADFLCLPAQLKAAVKKRLSCPKYLLGDDSNESGNFYDEFLDFVDADEYFQDDEFDDEDDVDVDAYEFFGDYVGDELESD